MDSESGPVETEKPHLGRALEEKHSTLFSQCVSDQAVKGPNEKPPHRNYSY